MSLHLAFCSTDAARFACHAWHYTRSLPAGRRVHVGVWEAGRFVGVVIFSRGSCLNIGRPFRLRQSEVCELTRVALAPHRTPTSRVVSIAVRLLRRQSPGLRLVVSYADPGHDHIGTIYQAGGWLYVGVTGRECVLRVHGRLRHPRSVASRYGHRGIAWLRRHVDEQAERVAVLPKHKYLYPLDADMRAELAPLGRPYPKRLREREADSGRPVPTGRDGASPIRSLQLHEAANV